MKIEIDFDDTKVHQAFERAPEVMHRHLDDALSRGADEIALAAKRFAPKFNSTLANSIEATPAGDLEYVVRPGVDYAAHVEHGSKPGYTPNLLSLQLYLRTKMGRRPGGRWAKAGSKKAMSQEAELNDAVDRLAWHIRAHGTKAHPFMKPAKDEKDRRVRAMMKAAVGAGLDEVFGGG